MATGHENHDANVRSIVWTLAGVAAGAALRVFGLVYGIFRYLADHPLAIMEPAEPDGGER